VGPIAFGILTRIGATFVVTIFGVCCLVLKGHGFSRAAKSPLNVGGL
jgi:hypothetical protein